MKKRTNYHLDEEALVAIDRLIKMMGSSISEAQSAAILIKLGNALIKEKGYEALSILNDPSEK